MDEVDEDIKKKLDQIAQEMDAQDQDTKRLFEELDLNKYVTNEENEFASSSSSLAAATAIESVDTEHIEPSALSSPVKEADYLRARQIIHSEDEEGYKKSLNEIERISTAFSHLQSQYSLECGKNEHLKVSLYMFSDISIEITDMMKIKIEVEYGNGKEKCEYDR